jgi:ubiquinol-cytochrome c reductase cytochrome b/c1 subunit
MIINHVGSYPTPIILNYFWSFGSLAGLCLVIQIVTGVFLSMHYTAHADLAFLSVEHIMRDVRYGWLMRYTHSNGASVFFMVVYVHMARGLYYTSYAWPRELVWYTGVVIFILMMAIAFTGYVLPWGQMSFWGVTVITNLFSAIPLVGSSITGWLWGGYSVDDPTLIRFYTIHIVLPWILVGVVILHITLLHQVGSNNPVGIDCDYDLKAFFPYFVYKDIFVLSVFLTFFGFLVFFEPNLLGHPDNYIKANALKTPAHIVPEWYFLPFYAILRAIPNKLGGVVFMGLAIGIWFLLPRIYRPIYLAPRFKPFFMINFWIFITVVLWLGYLGGQPANDLNLLHSQYFTAWYFSYFLIILPISNKVERAIHKTLPYFSKFKF